MAAGENEFDTPDLEFWQMLQQKNELIYNTLFSHQPKNIQNLLYFLANF